MSSRLSYLSLALPAACLLALTPPAALAAPAPGKVLAFDIQPGPLDAALIAFAAQSRIQLLYTPDLVAGRTTPGLRGRVPAGEALARLLAGSGLEARESRPGVMTLRPVRSAPADAALALPEIVVTGSHIRGTARGASPVVVLDRDAIDDGGYATVADALTALTQNFGGTGTPDTTTTSVDLSGSNTARATSVNLRGLGSDATLVLINGRRMAGSGSRGDFADISAIPTAAIERVEVLLDGASATYGSDAVGGVVNIRLRRDFDGDETRVRFGGAKDFGEQAIAHTFGRTWSSGSLLASYEFHHRDPLSFDDRAFTASADLRPFGGTDRRGTFASPGNILIANPATGALVPTYAIPDGAGAFPLKPGDFRLGAVNRDDPRRGVDLLPEQDRHSLYANLVQRVGEDLELSADVRFSRRAFGSWSLAPTATLTVTDANPFFSSPVGARSHQIAYSFIDDLGPTRVTGKAESLGLSLGGEMDLAAGWRLEAYGAFAQEDSAAHTTGSLNSLFLREALGATADNPDTAYRASVDGYFNPFGSGAANGAAVLDFIGSGFTRSDYRSQIRSVSAKADGKVFSLPGGDLLAAVGVQARTERLDQTVVNFVSTVAPVASPRPRSERTITAAFLELRAPLVGPQNARPGIQRLELSLAGRVERYEDIGSTADPKVGLVWTPLDDLQVRATYGTSFRAPNLVELFAAPSINAIFLPRGSARALVLNLNGGNADLEPERARSWTAGIDYAPQAIPGFKVSATWFDTVFDRQIDRPVNSALSVALTDPAYSPFVTQLDPTNPADLARVAAILADPAYTSPGLYAPNAFSAIVDSRWVNTTSLKVRGLDLTATYRVQRDADQFDLAASASYLADYRQQLTPTSASAQLLDQAGRPVALRLRTSAGWRRNAFGLSVAINYTDDYRSEAGVRIDSWTTLDAQLRWAPTAGPLEGVSAALSVQNLFDTDPPFHDAPSGVGYDAANADPLGRQVSLQLTKRW